jgi:hypothetical protein
MLVGTHPNGEESNMADSPESDLTSCLNAVHLGIGAGFFHLPDRPTRCLSSSSNAGEGYTHSLFRACSGGGVFWPKKVARPGEPMVSNAVGLLLNSLGGVLFSAMALVQLAVGSLRGGEKVSASLNGIWLGMDKAWDAYRTT